MAKKKIIQLDEQLRNMLDSAQAMIKQADFLFREKSFRESVSFYEKALVLLCQIVNVYHYSQVAISIPISQLSLNAYITSCEQNIRSCRNAIELEGVLSSLSQIRNLIEYSSNEQRKGEYSEARRAINEASSIIPRINLSTAASKGVKMEFDRLSNLVVEKQKAMDTVMLAGDLSFSEKSHTDRFSDMMRKEQDSSFLEKSHNRMEGVIHSSSGSDLSHNPSEILTNRFLKDLYTIAENIGTGGYATVFRAIRIRDGIEVALKSPRMTNEFETISGNILSSFENEAGIWAKLDHPNIVKLYEYGTRPYPWMAMELMKGGCLRKHLPLSNIGESWQIFEGILEGIQYAHHRGIVHRDIKPENILFSMDGTSKISDWGIAKVLLSMSKSSTSRYTLMYAAPEQLSPKRYGAVDWWTDVYQLGVTIYEMVSGRLPFQGDDPGEIMQGIIDMAPPKPSSINPGISSEIDDAIMKAIEKDPKKRYESVSEFKNELRDVLLHP